MLLAVMLFPCVPLCAAAEGERAVSCYYLEDAFHAAIAGADNSTALSASLFLDNAIAVKQQAARSYYAYPVEYLLLIDLSSSMRSKRDCVSAFAEALCAEERSRNEVTLLGFGERLEVIAERMTDPDAVSDTLRKLKYDHQASDIGEGLRQAINYQAVQKITPGALVNLVLLTDGTPYISGSNDAQAVTHSAMAAQALIESAPQLIVHTVYIGPNEPDQATMTAARAGTGEFCQIEAKEKAALQAAAQVTGFISKLSCFDFSTPWTSQDAETEVQFRLDTTAFLKMEHVPHLERINTVQPGNDDPPFPEIAEDTTQDASAPSESVPEESVPTESTQDLTVADDTGVPAGAEDVLTETASAETETEPVQQETGLSLPVMLLIGCGVLVAAVIVLLVILLAKRRRQPAVQLPSGDSGILIGMELLAGSCETAAREFRLRDELVIGSAPSCDIVVQDPAVSARNTRIFMQDQMIYIQDMNAESITLLNNMKIHAPNRLRSGDVVVIGSVQMRFRF